MQRLRPSFLRRLRAGRHRGAALPLGALFLVATVVVLLAAWQREEDRLRLAEIDRERGRIWAMTCTAVHRAVQSGRVTAAGRVTPAQLKGWSLLPAGLGAVGRAGGTVATATYGAVLDAAGAPLAACSLAGPELAFRAPALRAGAVMGGLDVVGEVGGEATAMHARLGAVRAALGPLPAGSLFATADWGIGHDADRLHRRRIGGRPELSRMETDFVFGPNTAIGDELLPVGEIEDAVPVTAGDDCRTGTLPAARRCFAVLDAGRVEGIDAGTNRSGRVVFDPLDAASGRVETDGNVTVGRAGTPGSMAFAGPDRVSSASGLRADSGFRFGDTGTPPEFNIPQLLTVGGELALRGEAAAGSLEIGDPLDPASGRLEVGGRLEASGSARVLSGTLAISGDLGADSGSFSGSISTGGCTGCERVPVFP